MYEQKPESTTFSALAFSLRLAYSIAIPLVLLTIGGVALDRHFHTKPLFLLMGVGISILFSSYGIYRTVKPILSDLAGPDQPSKPSKKDP